MTAADTPVVRLATAQIGALVIAVAWLAKGNIVAAVVNALWLVGLTAAWRHTGAPEPDPRRAP